MSLNDITFEEIEAMTIPELIEKSIIYEQIGNEFILRIYRMLKVMAFGDGKANQSYIKDLIPVLEEKQGNAYTNLMELKKIIGSIKRFQKRKREMHAKNQRLIDMGILKG